MSVKITLQDAYKTSTDDQDKIMSPEETIATYRDRLQSAQLDILDHTERIDNGRLDIPVFFSVCGKDGQAIIGNKKQMGKGATPAQAEASAIMELAERFSFFSFCKNPAHFTIDTYANLKAGRAALRGHCPFGSRYDRGPGCGLPGFRNHPHALDPGLEPHRRARGHGALRLVLRHQ